MGVILSLFGEVCNIRRLPENHLNHRDHSEQQKELIRRFRRFAQILRRRKEEENPRESP
jgi:hypothetical protein